MLPSLLPLAFSATFLIEPRATRLGMTTAHGELVPPTSISNQKNGTTPPPIEAILQLRCVKLAMKIAYHNLLLCGVFFFFFEGKICFLEDTN